jgi:hypothetical protein
MNQRSVSKSKTSSATYEALGSSIVENSSANVFGRDEGNRHLADDRVLVSEDAEGGLRGRRGRTRRTSGENNKVRQEFLFEYFILFI